MRFVIETIDGPESEPVTLGEMKRHLGEFSDVTDRDDDITALITVAREWVEGFTGRILFEQTLRLSVGDIDYRDEFARQYPRRCGEYARSLNALYLRCSPVLSISSVVTVDADGAETEVGESEYALIEADSKWPRLLAKSTSTWLNARDLRVTFRAGFADTSSSPQQDATSIPARFKQAMKLHAEAHYNRDANMELLLKAAENLIRPERVEIGFA